MTNSSNNSHLSYLDATGPIPYGMTNDYMFRLILEKNNYVLKGLISSLLSLSPDEIASAKIQNPILLNDAINDKEFILDIKVLLNNSAFINLEMQMAAHFNWKERSLSYLCRAFDQLMHGQPYNDVRPAVHIGFLNFNPSPDEEPEFYSSYKLLNEKTYSAYSDKFILRVVNLKQINLATTEDRANRVDYWARLFTAKTWEEIKMLAESNPFLASASQSLYESNADEITREKCRAREDYDCLIRTVAEMNEKNNQQELTIAQYQKDNTVLKNNYTKLEHILAEYKRRYGDL